MSRFYQDNWHDDFPFRAPRPRTPWTAYLWPALFLLLVAALLLWRFGPEPTVPSAGIDPGVALRTVAPRGDLADSEKGIIQLYKEAAPSVVNVTSIAERKDLWSRNVARLPRGTGSGFFWDDRGRIVTNYHVIAEGNAVQVTLADRSTYPAAVVGYDASRDLAVLQIQAPPARLRPLRLGESKNLQVGQSAYAIGNPFGLDQTLSNGLVSALNRSIESPNGQVIKGVIQTTATINPGNSGGPLLDSDGRLIGVNTAIFSSTGQWAGIGFAIPVDEVNQVVTRIIRGS